MIGRRPPHPRTGNAHGAKTKPVDVEIAADPECAGSGGVGSWVEHGPRSFLSAGCQG
nr:hypothetical protein [Gluconobacter frateurii]